MPCLGSFCTSIRSQRPKLLPTCGTPRHSEQYIYGEIFVNYLLFIPIYSDAEKRRAKLHSLLLWQLVTVKRARRRKLAFCGGDAITVPTFRRPRILETPFVDCC